MVTSISVRITCLHAEREIPHGNLFLHAIVDAVHVLILVTREMQNRFAHGLAGNSAGIDAHASHAFHFFHQRDALAGLRRLYGRALPSRAGPDYDQIKSLYYCVRQFNRRNLLSYLQYIGEAALQMAKKQPAGDEG